MYREEILDLYRKPVNVGSIENGRHAEGDNPSCGDSTDIYVEVNDGVVKDVKHETDACAIATASICIVSEELEGMNVEEVKELDRDWMLDRLDVEVSPMRMKCALLGLRTVQEALKSKAD